MIEVGLALTPGPLKGDIGAWLADYAQVLPQLEGKISSLWMPDHFFWEDMPTYEAMTVLTYMAASFPNFMVGSSVLGQSYRNPALLAKMGNTLHTLSNGRFILGIGAGWKEDEYVGYGYPYPNAKLRLQELDEALTIIKTLWAERGPHSFAGQHYQISNAYCEPLLEKPPTIMIGGGGKTTMRLAAKHADWWNLSDVNFEAFKARMDILEGHCHNLGRDFSTIRKTWFGRLVLGNSMEEARERGLAQGRSHYDGWTLEGALVGTVADVLEQIRPFVEADVDYFMLEILDVEKPEILEMVLELLAETKQLGD
ncbi:MAG: LLM class flavin-dependent oxidoreductase [Chloroflexota bacterium]